MYDVWVQVPSTAPRRHTLQLQSVFFVQQMGLEEAVMNDSPVGCQNGADRGASSAENPVPSTAPRRHTLQLQSVFFICRGIAGKSPFPTPWKTRQNAFSKKCEKVQKGIDNHTQMRYNLSCSKRTAPIAQLDRAFDYESKGHRFESCWVHH